MSEAKFTPGPWDVERKDSGYIRAIGPCAADEYAGCSWLEVSDDDASLIAAAPDLYEALENFIESWSDETGMANPTYDDVWFARDALAKARGES